MCKPTHWINNPVTKPNKLYRNNAYKYKIYTSNIVWQKKRKTLKWQNKLNKQVSMGFFVEC